TQPQSRFGLIGQSVTFSVLADGPAPLHYQWRFNGDAIPGATSSTFTISNLRPELAGHYSVVVFNDTGSAASTVVSLTVAKPPSILQQPAALLLPPGTTATFTVTATGNGFLHYQWMFNGAVLAAETNASLVITNRGSAKGGTYPLTVRDSIVPQTSPPGSLTMKITPFIVQQPLSQNVVSGATLTISVPVTNTATQPLGYRVRRNNVT